MRKSLLIGYMALFLAVCAVPGIALLAGVESPNYEKRALAVLPALWDENGFNEDFPAEFDTYFSENFGLRPWLVTANAALRAALLCDSASDQVVVGREGWLYFGETLDDFLGRNLLTDEQIDRLARTLSLQREALAEQGTAFVVALAPNKNTIYPEFMPARFLPQSEDSNLTALQAALDREGVAYADLRAALLSARQDAQVYHKLDTHWNNRGALTAYRTLMEALSRQMPALVWEDYGGVTARLEQSWQGDLSVMLLPSLRKLDEQAVYDIEPQYQAVRPIHTAEDMSIETRSQANDLGLLIFRDSFANALIPFLSDAFGRVQYSRAVPYDYRLMENVDADAVILEIVERNIPQLLEYAPLLAAPRRDPVEAPEVSMDAAAGIREAGGGVVIYGRTDAAGVVKVRLRGAEDVCFEPFPILSGDDAQKLSGGGDNGFTLYLPQGALPAGEYALSLTVETEGGAAASGTLATVTLP